MFHPLSPLPTTLCYSLLFRSIRDNKPRSLCLTETVLEHTDAHGVPSVLHLSNVLGAKASRAVGAGVAGAYLLEVFAYVPNEGSVGCTKGCVGGAVLAGCEILLWCFWAGFSPCINFFRFLRLLVGVFFRRVFRLSTRTMFSGTGLLFL